MSGRLLATRGRALRRQHDAPMRCCKRRPVLCGRGNLIPRGLTLVNRHARDPNEKACEKQARTLSCRVLRFRLGQAPSRRHSIPFFKVRDLIRSLPVRSASGLPVYLAASPAARFSTSVGMTECRGRAGGFA